MEAENLGLESTLGDPRRIASVNPRVLQTWLLRLTGSVELGAFVAVAMPRPWMEAGHTWLGLGEMPQGAIVNFMIRQASFTYGLHGVLLWLLSWDVARFRPLVVFTGVSYVVAAPVFFMIDLTSGMPWFWTVGDAGSCLAFGGALLGLVWWEHQHGAATAPEGTRIAAGRCVQNAPGIQGARKPRRRVARRWAIGRVDSNLGGHRFGRASNAIHHFAAVAASTTSILMRDNRTAACPSPNPSEAHAPSDFAPRP